MTSSFKHRDKLEKNKGLIMQISIVTSLLIVLLLFENKTRSAELSKDAYIGIEIDIDQNGGNKLTLPIPNTENNSIGDNNKNRYEAEFPGGYQALKRYMSEEMEYSQEARKKDIQGRVIVRFTVTEKGKIKNARVIRSIHPIIDTEALRLILHMPDWRPEMINGNPVSSTQTLPVIFINKEEHES